MSNVKSTLSISTLNTAGALVTVRSAADATKGDVQTIQETLAEANRNSSRCIYSTSEPTTCWNIFRYSQYFGTTGFVIDGFHCRLSGKAVYTSFTYESKSEERFNVHIVFFFNSMTQLEYKEHYTNIQNSSKFLKNRELNREGSVSVGKGGRLMAFLILFVIL